MELIPTFKPGQRVMLDYHAVEDRCPKCGAARCGRLGDAGKRSVVTVVGPAGPTACWNCHEPFECLDGWWQIMGSGGGTASAPYTLLRLLEEETNDGTY